MVTVVYLPTPEPATDTTYGVVKVDDDTIKVNDSGQIYIARVPA